MKEVEEQDDLHAASEFTNTRPEQIPRTTEIPVDNYLVGTIVTSTNTIPLAILLDENVELHHNINLSHLNL